MAPKSDRIITDAITPRGNGACLMTPDRKIKVGATSPIVGFLHRLMGRKRLPPETKAQPLDPPEPSIIEPPSEPRPVTPPPEHSDQALSALRNMARDLKLATTLVSLVDRVTVDASRVTVGALGDDLPMFWAVTRVLGDISDGSRRLPAELKARYPWIAWRNLAETARSTVTRKWPLHTSGMRFKISCRLCSL